MSNLDKLIGAYVKAVPCKSCPFLPECGDGSPSKCREFLARFCNDYKKDIGEWQKVDASKFSESPYSYRCNRCKSIHLAKYNYCPTCGTRMENSKARGILQNQLRKGKNDE